VIAEQAKLIADLQDRMTRLERALSRNSGNSSMPPSADDLPGRRPPSRQQRRASERAARKRGKQPGAPGAAMSWAVPDEVTDHYPAGACACGTDLAAAADLGSARSYQQVEIPDATARRVQHDLHRARCGCGREHLAARPPGVPDAAVSVGPNLRALAVYLLVFQHVPVERCRMLIQDVTGAAVSDGFIHSCLATAAGAAAGAVNLIKALITAEAVAGFDETTLRCGPAGQKRYVLGAFTEKYSALFLGERTLESFRAFGILPAFSGVVVSDRYQNYFHDGWEHLAGHQACLAHLLRDYEDAAQCWPGAIWPEQAQRSLRGLIRAWRQAAAAGLPEMPPRIRDPLIREFRHAVLAGLSDVPRIPGPKRSTAQHPGRDLLEFCHARQADVLRFCHDTAVWPTNNISEVRHEVARVKWVTRKEGRLMMAAG